MARLLFYRDRLQLEMRAAQQSPRSDESSRRKILLEIASINWVEFVVERNVGAEDLHSDQVVHSHSSLGQYVLNPVDHQPSLLFDIARNLVGLRVSAQPSGQIERVADHHAVAERGGDGSVRQIDDAPSRASAALAVDGHAAQEQADQQTTRQTDKEHPIFFHFVLRGKFIHKAARSNTEKVEDRGLKIEDRKSRIERIFIT